MTLGLTWLELHICSKTLLQTDSVSLSYFCHCTLTRVRRMCLLQTHSELTRIENKKKIWVLGEKLASLSPFTFLPFWLPRGKNLPFRSVMFQRLKLRRVKRPNGKSPVTNGNRGDIKKLKAFGITWPTFAKLSWISGLWREARLYTKCETFGFNFAWGIRVS